MTKLLSAPDPARRVSPNGAGRRAGRVLPGPDAEALDALAAVEARLGLVPDPMRRLAALGGPDPADRLRLSRPRRRGWSSTCGDDIRGGAGRTGYRHGMQAAREILALRAAATGIAPADADLARARQGRGGEVSRPPCRPDARPTGPALGAACTIWRPPGSRRDSRWARRNCCGGWTDRPRAWSCPASAGYIPIDCPVGISEMFARMFRRFERWSTRMSLCADRHATHRVVLAVPVGLSRSRFAASIADRGDVARGGGHRGRADLLHGRVVDLLGSGPPARSGRSRAGADRCRGLHAAGPRRSSRRSTWRF